MVFNKIFEYVNIHWSFGHFNDFCDGIYKESVSVNTYIMYIYTVPFRVHAIKILCNVLIIAIDGVQLQ